MNAELAITEFQVLLSQAGGSYIKAFDILAAQTQAAAVSTRKPTKADKLSAAEAVITSKDPEALAEIRKVFTDWVKFVKTSPDIDAQTLAADPKAKLHLMKEFLAYDKAFYYLQADRERIRKLVFEAVALNAAAAGASDPDNVNGDIEVPALGKKFSKYGCGTKTPTVNEDMLRELVGEKVWKKSCVTTHVPQQVIPAHTEQKFSIEKYMEAVSDDPELMYTLKEAMRVGEAKTPSFTVKDL